jgi:DNA-binding CsgD family transcriptional regulator/tetratricopeptide (TPR) repeat protein
MRLLERDEPLATLDLLRIEASTEGGRLVFVEGEAGVGKTSVLRAFRAALPSGSTALLGSCDPLSTPRPLGPFVDVADDLDADLARLVRTEAPRQAILAALLAALRERGDLVLLIDDLHWADEATLDALRFIGRRIASTQALVVGTYRDDEVGRQHPLRVVVGDLATSPSVRRLVLRPLSVGAVEELARGTDLDAEELHHHTGGNPFYVTEVIAGAPARMPRTVRDAVLARAARLSPAARETLDAAAVIGAVVEPALLRRVVGAPAAEEALEHGLLQTDGRAYAFRHELARQAILDSTDPGTRTALHAQVLAALEAQPHDGGGSARLAHHAEEAGDRDAVLRHALDAARHASKAGAHREAADQLGRAARFAAGMPAAERAGILHELARESSIVARYDVALPAFEQAAALYRETGASRSEAIVEADLAKSLVSAGRNADAEAASRRALEIVAMLPDGPEKAEALNAQAYLRMLDRDNAEAIELGQAAIRMGADAPDAVATVIQAWNTVGSSRILLGDDGGRADLETSLRMALERGMDRQAASAYSVLASALGEMYRFDDADPYFDAGRRFAAERDLDSSRLYLEAWLALSLMYRGRWSEAGAVAADVLAAPANSAISQMMALLAVGRLRARRGDPDTWVALDDAWAMAEPTATLQRIGPVAAARAEAAWLAGDLDRSGAEAALGLQLAVSHRHPWHVGELGWWLRRAGRDPGDLEPLADPWRHQHAADWRAAAGAWDAVGCPFEAARALLESTEPEDVLEAHARFDTLGALPAAALAMRRLRKLGVRSIPRGRRPSTRANPAGLTARELEVLRLVAGGLQNHQIAARLYLSPRTVDHHVSAVLGKLAVGSRAEVGAAAAALGIELRPAQGVVPD